MVYRLNVKIGKRRPACAWLCNRRRSGAIRPCRTASSHYAKKPHNLL